MKKEDLFDLFNQFKVEELEWEGTCYDCRCQMKVEAKIKNEIEVEILGGSVYKVGEEEIFLKCNKCFQKERELKNFQKCEVYSRCVGYLRPIAQWNEGKQQEFKDRKMFEVER